MRLHAILLIAALAILSIPACGGGNANQPLAPTYPTGKPTGVAVTAASQSANLHWNPVAGATGYFVYISNDGISFRKYRGQPITTTEFLVLDLTNGQTYYFGVSAVGVGGWETSIAYPGGAPTAVPVKPKAPGIIQNPWVGVPPAPPKNLQGVAKDAAVEIEWELSPEGDFSNYRIYRCDHSVSDSFELLRDDYGTTDFRDTDLIDGTTYSYYVTAVDIEGLESNPSNTVTLTPQDFPPEPIQNLEIFVNAGRIVLEWSIPQEADIASYIVERVESVDPVTKAEVVVRFKIDKVAGTKDNPTVYLGGLVEAYMDIPSNTFTIRDMAVTVGVKYTYRVSALDISGQQGPPVPITAPLAVY
jgi:hypothetical protein